MRLDTILRVATKFILPLMLLFALYVQFHGDYGPGGGFQAGVIAAATIILYGLIYGLPAALKMVPATVVETLDGAARRLCDRRIALVMEGGYHLTALRECLEAATDVLS